MRRLVFYITMATLITSFLSVSIMAEEEGFSVEEQLKLERKHHKQDNPTNLWRFQITTPSDRDVQPPAFYWFSASPYMASTLPPVYGNQIYIRKDTKDVED